MNTETRVIDQAMFALPTEITQREIRASIPLFVGVKMSNVAE